MKDFLEILRAQMEPTMEAQNQSDYINQLKDLASHSSDLRPLPVVPRGSVLRTRIVKHPNSLLTLTEYDLGLIALKEGGADSSWFRLAKQADSERAFLRWDAVADDTQVLESIAMGADAYSLQVGDHDSAGLQYLCELGHDYGVPALLHCYGESQVARALAIEAETIIHLAGELAQPQLLELPIFENRTVLIRYHHAFNLSAVSATANQFARLILHFDSIGERSPFHD